MPSGVSMSSCLKQLCHPQSGLLSENEVMVSIVYRTALLASTMDISIVTRTTGRGEHGRSTKRDAYGIPCIDFGMNSSRQWTPHA